jgi:hypothetical protein
MTSLRFLFAALALVATCAASTISSASTGDATAPLEVSYRVQRDTVRVEFQDRNNFRFVASDGAQTIIKDGAIYLIVKQAGRPDSVILVSDRRVINDALESPTKVSKTVALGKTARIDLTVYAKQKAPQLHRTSLHYRNKPAPLVLISSKDAALAGAQHTMRETLSAMDMTMCGATVQALVAAWVPELTRQGHAVLGTNNDIEITALPAQSPAAHRVTLPSGQPVLDYRLPAAPAPAPANTSPTR